MLRVTFLNSPGKEKRHTKNSKTTLLSKDQLQYIPVSVHLVFTENENVHDHLYLTNPHTDLV